MKVFYVSLFQRKFGLPQNLNSIDDDDDDEYAYM